MYLFRLVTLALVGGGRGLSPLRRRASRAGRVPRRRVISAPRLMVANPFAFAASRLGARSRDRHAPPESR